MNDNTRFFKFKSNKCGSHSENGKVYTPKDIVPSVHDLAKAFPHKFEEVAGVESVLPLVNDVETKAKPPKNAKTPVKESPVVDEPVSVPEPEEELEETEDITTITSELGKNVTKNYREAIDGGVLILQKGSHFRVAMPSLPDISMTPKAMTKAKLENYLAEL